MTQAMTFKEFAEVVKHIQQYNSPFSCVASLPVVKYIDPVFDMRTNSVFAISFRGFGDNDVSFHTQNECSNLPETLKDRIMNYLTTPRHEVNYRG